MEILWLQGLELGESSRAPRTSKSLPGKPVAYNRRLLWLVYGLLHGIVACHFRLLGVPGHFIIDILSSSGWLCSLALVWPYIPFKGAL